MIPLRLIPLAALLIGSGPALAVSLDCSTVQGVVHTAPAFVTVNLQQGETLNISTPDAGTLAVSIEFGGQGGTDDGICNPAFDGTSCDGFSHTAALTGDYGVEAFAQSGDTFTLSCGGGGSGAAAQGGRKAAQGMGAFASASTSVGFVGSAINSTLSGGAPASVTRNGLFLSTYGDQTGMTGWAALQGRVFDGDIDGSAHELTFGLDYEVGASTRLGFFLSAGRSDLDVSGVSVDSDALSIGPYFKSHIGDRYNVTGYALFARPDYDVGGVTYQAERRLVGQVVAGQLGPPPRGAHHVDLAQAGMTGVQRPEGQAEPSQRRRPGRGDQHVGVGQQGVQPLPGVLPLEVERDQFLAAVQVAYQSGW